MTVNIPFQFSAAARADVGRRDNQEDAFFLTPSTAVADGLWLGIVSDGMGGHANGEVASRLAVEVFKNQFHQQIAAGQSPADGLSAAIKVANSAVIDKARQMGRLNNMGATLIAAAMVGDRLYWVGTGDSRLFLMRAGQLVQISRDFTLDQDLQDSVAGGHIEAASIETIPNRQALTSFIGLDSSKFRFASGNFQIQENDWVILCSDGIYGFLPAGTIETCCRGSAPEAIECLFTDHLLPGMTDSQDNATAIMVSIGRPTAAVAQGKTDTQDTAVFPAPQPDKRKFKIAAALIGLALAGAATAYLLIGRTPPPASPEIAKPATLAPPTPTPGPAPAPQAQPEPPALIEKLPTPEVAPKGKPEIKPERPKLEILKPATPSPSRAQIEKPPGKHPVPEKSAGKPSRAAKPETKTAPPAEEKVESKPAEKPASPPTATDKPTVKTEPPAVAPKTDDGGH